MFKFIKNRIEKKRAAKELQKRLQRTAEFVATLNGDQMNLILSSALADSMAVPGSKQYKNLIKFVNAHPIDLGLLNSIETKGLVKTEILKLNKQLTDDMKVLVSNIRLLSIKNPIALALANNEYGC